MRVEYSEDSNTAWFDGYKFRKDRKTGYFLASKPTNGKKRERLHCYVWRYFNQAAEIPAGYHIHHKDGNKDHNDIENLACVKETIHLSHHSNERIQMYHAEISENLKNHAAPKAAEWHRSEEGRKWHSEHAKEVAEDMKPRKFVCQNCGKEFWRKPLGQIKFCSNNCKSAARRNSGVDDEIRKCEICGKEYRTNKYSPAKYCGPECRAVGRNRVNSVKRN